MKSYVEFTGPAEQTSVAAYSSLQLASNPDDETLVDDEPVEDRLDELAAEFVERYRKGESPTIADYAKQYPDLAQEICDLFPTIAQMEGLKVQIEQDQQPNSKRGLIAGHVPLSQLGDFRIIREIGRGGMGVVYEAEQMSLGRRVAIKALPLLSVSQPELVKRFQREARTAARLHHTNIVPVFGVGEAEGFHYYVMQLIDGISLDTFTDDNTNTRSDSIASQLMTELDGHIDESQSPSLDDSFSDQETKGERSAPENSDSIATAKSIPVKPANSGRSPSVLDDLLHDNSTNLSIPSLPKVDDPAAIPQCASAASPAIVDSRSTEGASGTHSQPVTQEAGSNQTVADDMEHPELTTQQPRIADARPDESSVCDSPKNPSSDQTLSIAQIVDIGIQASDGLHYAHAQGTLHRDIKPGNLMLDGDGVVWVTDFGLAKAMEGDDLTHTENVVGTIRYMAPEQFRGSTDSRSDIYSLGITLYELVTRKRAWSATSRSSLINEIMDGQLTPLHKIVEDIPRDLETVILKATAHEVHHRYQTAGELAEDLRRFASDRPILARRAGSLERIWRWARRNPVVAGLSVATTLSLTMFAVAAAVGYAAEREQRERAEETSDLAFEALDRIFEKFAPGDSMATSSPSLASDGSSSAEHAVLSPEAAQLLAGMLEFYERLASQSDDDPRLLLKCAQARQRVGDIYQRLGKYDSAISSYRIAISDYENLAAHIPSNSFGNPSLIKAGLLNGIGSCELMLAQQDASQDSHGEAMNLLNALSPNDQQLPDVRYERARTHSLLARRLRPGESVTSQQFAARGSREFPRGNDLRPEPGERFGPGEHRRPEERFGPGQRPGPNEFRSGPASRNMAQTRQERFRHFAEAIAILETLTTEAPDVARYRFLLALCLRETSLQRNEDNNATLNRACKLLEALVNEYPELPEYRLALAESYAQAEGRHERQRPEELELAETSLAMAAEHARQLVEEHPTVPAYTNSLIHILSRLATSQERHAQEMFGSEHRTLMAESERNLHSALELQESLVRREPNVGTFHIWSARFRNSIARILRLQGRQEEARQIGKYAIERLAEYPTSAGGIATQAETMGILYHSLGNTLRSMGEVESAVDAMLSAEEQFDLAAAERARQSLK
jgi:serine/threonine protein kinase/tetratricopeptide (TPR) repeat protein